MTDEQITSAAKAFAKLAQIQIVGPEMAAEAAKEILRKIPEDQFAFRDASAAEPRKHTSYAEFMAEFNRRGERIRDLQKQVEQLTKERDEARNEASALRSDWVSWAVLPWEKKQ